MNLCRKLIVIGFCIALFGCGVSQGDKQLTIQEFITALESNGMTIGKQSEKMYVLLMATDGCGIEVNGDSIEIYQFDTTIKSGKEALEKWKNEGFLGQPVLVNHNLMLFADKKHKYRQEIVKVFNRV